MAAAEALGVGVAEVEALGGEAEAEQVGSDSGADEAEMADPAALVSGWAVE